MAEALGKIEKPPVDGFLYGRKLYFVPLVYCPKEAPAEFGEICDRYWAQVESQISGLEEKLSPVKRVYHELVTAGDDLGVDFVKDLNEQSYQLIAKRTPLAQLEATEDEETLSEYMDWGRCLYGGFQSQAVFKKVYELYTETGKRRNESIFKRIDETLKPDESGILFFSENHQLQFPSDIQVFYVSPPALDEMKRWSRDQEAKAAEEAKGAEEAEVKDKKAADAGEKAEE